MKTSNYILIGFLTFIALVLVSWHVDSSLYEEEYDRKKKAKSEFYKTRKWLKNDNNSPKKRQEFIAIAEEYFKYYSGYYDYASAADLLNSRFNIYKDTFNLKLARKWVDKAYKLKPKNRYVNEVYLKTLENLGYNEEAKPYLDFIKKIDSIEGFELIEYKNDKEEVIRVRKRMDTTTVFKYEEYKNEKGEVIKVRKPVN